MIAKRECSICVQNLNKTTRAPVVCPDPECGFECCRECLKEYIVTQRHDPKCMKCSKAFARIFLHTVLPASWIKNTFIGERESILLEREKSMVPDTMPWVDAEVAARVCDKEVATLHDTLAELAQKTRDIMVELSARRQTVQRLRDGELSVKGKQKKFIVKCPECPAFMNRGGKCTSCGTRICMHCRDTLVLEEGRPGTVDDIVVQVPPEAVPLGDEGEGAGAGEGDDVQRHSCLADTLATARMIEHDTKPCPKCGARIHKIEGCDQMFDTQCGTAFSWKTGQIVTGVIHNPHFYQWQRDNGGVVARQPGDVVCGGPIGPVMISAALGWTPDKYAYTRLFKSNGGAWGAGEGMMWPKCVAGESGKAANAVFCEDIHMRWLLEQAARVITHISEVELPRLSTGWDHTTNRPLRVMYIMGGISEDAFKAILATRERQVEKDRETQQIFDTFVQGGTDVLRKFIAPFADFDHSKGAIKGMKRGLPQHLQEVTISLIELMGHDEEDEEKGGLERWWWASTPGTIRCSGGLTRNVQYKRRLVNSQNMVVPSRAVVKGAYDEMKALEGYCNAEFEKISKAWKLQAPEIAIDDDRVRMKSWYKC